MDDRFYPNGNNRRSNNNSHPLHTSEPHYEDGSMQDDFDDIFTHGAGNANNGGHNNGRFTVTLPENAYSQSNIRPDASAQSRVPRGRPVSETENDIFLRENPRSPGQHSENNARSRIPTGSPVGYSDVNSRRSANPAQKNFTAQNRQRQNAAKPVPKKPSAGIKKADNFSPKSPASGSEDISSASARPKRRRTGRMNGKKIAACVVAVLLILLTAVFAYGYSIIGKINYDSTIRENNKYIKSSQLASSKDVKNVLFIGSDARGDVAGMRSDTMMLFSIDKKNKKIKLTSFLRDSYVCIPSTGNYRKLNAACSSGGAQLVIDTIEYNFKIDIDNYVLVDFEAFTKFIDELGGLDVEGVTQAEADYLHDVVKVPKVKKGKNHFTGGATLWYCRIRYLDDDFHRTERQRKVISALMKKIGSTNPIKTINAVETIMPMISSDIPRNELIGIGIGAITQYLRYDIVQHQIPAKGTWSDPYVSGEGQVLKMDIEKNTKLLHDFLYKSKDSSKKSKK